MSHLILDLFLVIDVILPSEDVNTELHSGFSQLTALSCYERTGLDSNICIENENVHVSMRRRERKSTSDGRRITLILITCGIIGEDIFTCHDITVEDAVPQFSLLSVTRSLKNIHIVWILVV